MLKEMIEMHLPAAYVTALASTKRELLSARPDAPVVPHVEPVPRTRMPRALLARVLSTTAQGLLGAAHHLQRAAGVVAPAGQRPAC